MNKRKTQGYYSLGVALFIVIAVGVFTVAVVHPSAQISGTGCTTNTALQTSQLAARPACDSQYTGYTTWLTKLQGSEYTNIKNGVSSAILTLDSLITRLSSVLNIKRTTIQSTCNQMLTTCNGTQAIVLIQQITTANDQVVSVFVPFMDYLVVVDEFYGKADKAADERDYLAAAFGENDFARYISTAGGLNELGTALNAQLTAATDLINAIETDMPPASFYEGIVNKPKAEGLADLNTLKSKITANTTRVNNVSKSYSKGISSITVIMTAAAKDGVSPESLAEVLRARYTPIYNLYSQKAMAQCNSLKKTIATVIPRLEGATTGLDVLLPNVSASVRTAISNNAAALIEVLNDDFLKDALGEACDVSYNGVNATKAEYEALNIRNIFLPLLNTIRSFNGTLGRNLELGELNQLIHDTNTLLLSGLMPADADPKTMDQGDLNAIVGELDSDGVNLASLLSDRRQAMEGALIALLGTRNVETYKNLKKEVSLYTKDSGVARSAYNKMRTHWWKVVRQAAVEGKITIEGSALAEEVRAAKVFESFEKSRAAYYAKGTKIIDDRKASIAKKQVLADAKTNVPAGVKTALALGAKTTAYVTYLEQYKNEVILVQDNYFSLRDAVQGVKILGVPTYLNALAYYIRFDEYYRTLSGYEVILELLDARITALSAIAEKQAEAAVLDTKHSEIVQKITALRATMNTLLTNDVSDAVSLHNLLLEPYMLELYKSLKEDEKEVKVERTTISTGIRGLLSEIKALEAKQIVTP